ncbi:MAG: carboxypeptidase-like regulatory domain-containing protein [Bryobacterales bacterium]|nr:carboxypeptidase-like regulatory domain-containing protein [Bryobacterales bacterium]
MSVDARRRACLAAALAVLATLGEATMAQEHPPEQALLFGTVFRGSYLALEGARVVAYDEAKPKKKYRAITNYRGEYRIRVPAGDATYVVTASAPRFAQSQRTVTVYGIEKSTANLILEPRKKGGRTKNRPDSQ